MKSGVLPMHINFSTCSFKTKIVITCSAGNLIGCLFATSKWNGRDILVVALFALRFQVIFYFNAHKTNNI